MDTDQAARLRALNALGLLLSALDPADLAVLGRGLEPLVGLLSQKPRGSGGGEHVG